MKEPIENYVVRLEAKTVDLEKENMKLHKLYGGYKRMFICIAQATHMNNINGTIEELEKALLESDNNGKEE